MQTQEHPVRIMLGGTASSSEKFKARYNIFMALHSRPRVEEVPDKENGQRRTLNNRQLPRLPLS